MKPEDILQAAAARGFLVAGHTAAGVEDGYPVLLNAVSVMGAKATTLSFRLSGKPDKETVRTIRREQPGRGGVPVVRDDLLTVQVLVKKDTDIIWQALRSVIRILREAGIRPKEECPVCHGGGTNCYAAWDSAYTSAHRACIEEKCRSGVEKLETSQQNGGYGMGFLGALLGSFVGMIPTFITIFFTEYIVVWLCMLIPLAAYGGYRLFRGRRTRAATVIIILVSLLQIFIIEQAVWYASIVRAFDYWPSIFESIEVYFTLFDEEFLGDIGLIALFVGLGIVACFGIISKTAAGEIRDTMSILETIRDKGAAVYPAGPAMAAPAMESETGIPSEPYY